MTHATAHPTRRIAGQGVAHAMRRVSPKRRLKIVFVIDDLGLGGAQRQLTELVKALPKTDYEAHVISLSVAKRAYAKAIREADVPVTLIEQSGKWSWHAYRFLSRAIRSAQPDIVHTWLFTADLYGRIAAWRAKVPVIISAVRSVEPDKSWHYVLADRLLRFVTDAFTVNAKAVGEVLTKREHVSPVKIHTIYNGVDLASLDPSVADGTVRSQLSLGQATPLIGIIGRFAPVKDHATFLRAAALVLRRVPSAQFVLVGDGPLRAELKRLVHVLDIEPSVHFLGNHANMAEVVGALDLVVVSSRYEGCCNAILEGMAMAKPMIATAVGGNPELVAPDRTGLLVPPQDAEQLAQAIRQLLEDPQRARAMGRHGRQRIEEAFSVSQMMTKTSRLYRELFVRASR